MSENELLFPFDEIGLDQVEFSVGCQIDLCINFKSFEGFLFQGSLSLMDIFSLEPFHSDVFAPLFDKDVLYLFEL